MVNESDTFVKADYIAYNQFAARDLPSPKFSRPNEIKGGVTRPVRGISWSCDGRHIATGTEMKGLRIWDAKDKMDQSTSFPLPSGGDKTTPHVGHVAAVAFSPVEPNVMVSGCKSAYGGTCVAVWDITSPKTPTITFNIPGDVLHIAFHPSGRHFAVVVPKARDEVFFYWRVVRDGQEVWEKRTDVGLGGPLIDSGSEEINSLRYSNSGKLVCAVSNDGSVSAWVYPSNLQITTQVEITNTEEKPASRASTPRDGSPEQETTRATDGEDVEMSLQIPQDGPKDIASAPPSRKPTPPPIERSKQEVAISEARTRQLKRFRHDICHSASLLSLSFDPAGKYLAVGGQDALLSLLDTTDWICVRTFDACMSAIRHSAFSSDGEFIAMGGDDPYIAIVSVHSGALVAKIPVQGLLHTLAWHPTRNWLAYSTANKAVVWHMVQQE